MNDGYKNLIHEGFQKLIVISVFLIPCFYWPNHELRLMKFICFQTVCTILLCLSFLFTPKRTIETPYPALFLLIGFINLFTHGMSEYVNVGMGFIMPAITAIYVISNHLHIDYVPVVKKAIVLMCLLNCIIYTTEMFNLNVIFVHNVANGAFERSTGFMCYPASFALLCAVSMILAWNWNKWLILPIGAYLWISHEYSVIGGLILAVSMPFWKDYWKAFVIISLFIVSILGLLHWGRFNFVPFRGEVDGKIALRMKYLLPVFQNVWARPIDGAGVGMYNRLPDSFFGFTRGNWSEMHCEPLDLFFSMGFMGVACVVGGMGDLYRMKMEYKMMLLVIGFMSFFHSPFHFADTLFLSVVILSLAYVEKYEST